MIIPSSTYTGALVVHRGHLGARHQLQGRARRSVQPAADTCTKDTLLVQVQYVRVVVPCVVYCINYWWRSYRSQTFVLLIYTITRIAAATGNDQAATSRVTGTNDCSICHKGCQQRGHCSTAPHRKSISDIDNSDTEAEGGAAATVMAAAV